MLALAERTDRRVPGHLLAAAKRIDRSLEIVFDRKRGRWTVTRKGSGTDRCIVNGRWFYGRHIVIRWEHPDTEEYLPVDARLIARLHDMDSARRNGWRAHLAEMEAAEDLQREIVRNTDAQRAEAASRYFDAKEVKKTVWSVGGMRPGTTNKPR